MLKKVNIMRFWMIVLICGIFVFMMSGCFNGDKKTDVSSIIDSSSQLIPGSWSADQHNWVITINEKMEIESMTHSLGLRLNISEGGIRLEGPKGEEAIFVLGPCDVKYNADTNVMEVLITVDYFKMELPTGTLEGRIEDKLVGIVDTDSNQWSVKWSNYGWLEGADPPNKELIDADPVLLTFTKQLEKSQ